MYLELPVDSGGRLEGQSSIIMDIVMMVMVIRIINIILIIVMQNKRRMYLARGDLSSLDVSTFIGWMITSVACCAFGGRRFTFGFFHR
jgi:hypothetical protein